MQILHKFKLNDVYFLHVYGEKRYSVWRERQEAYCPLVALTLMITESRTEEKDVMVKVVVVVNLINKENK